MQICLSPIRPLVCSQESPRPGVKTSINQYGLSPHQAALPRRWVIDLALALGYRICLEDSSSITVLKRLVTCLRQRLSIRVQKALMPWPVSTA